MAPVETGTENVLVQAWILFLNTNNLNIKMDCECNTLVSMKNHSSHLPLCVLWIVSVHGNKHGVTLLLFRHNVNASSWTDSAVSDRSGICQDCASVKQQVCSVFIPLHTSLQHTESWCVCLCNDSGVKSDQHTTDPLKQTVWVSVPHAKMCLSLYRSFNRVSSI